MSTSEMDALAQAVVDHGVTRAFGVPGSGITLTLLDALERRGVPFHLTHFEGAGALMAATVGRLSRRAGLSLSIKGPGLANAAPGLAAAWFESFPLVHVAEAFPRESSPALAHKRLDQTTIVGPITKACRYRARQGPDFSEMAEFALTEEPGPVVFQLAPNSADSEPDLPEAKAIRGDADEALARIGAAKRPVVIAGSLAVRADLEGSLQQLSIPVFSTAAAKGVVNEASPHAAGVFSGVGLELTPERVLLPQSDLVVGIGLTARESLAVRPFGCTYLAVEAVPTPGTSAYAPAVRIGLGAAAPILQALSELPAWGIDELEHTRARLQRHMTAGFLPGAVLRIIERHFERRARLVLDTGYFSTIGEHAWRAASADLCLLSGQGRYMGTGLPMALGAALHDRTVPTIAVVGDGGIGVYLAEAKLSAQHNLPLLVVVMTDNAFASIRTRARRDGLTEKPLIMDGRSWVPVFEALGLRGARADTAPAVEDALAAWNPSSGPAFLEIPFDGASYEAMVAGIR